MNTQAANLVFAGPTSGVAATPTFRSLVAADLPAGTGTVTSVGLATGSGASDALYTISGSPVTTSGTLVETLNTQAKNTFLGGPISGANATPTFRGLNSADIPVPGSTGDVLYNNGGVLGAALTTITAAGSITIPDTQVIQWTGSAYSSVGLSQLAADTLAVGNGTESDVSGGMAMTALILYGPSYYSAYDAFHTTIYSGATQNWNLVLPETAGVNGQVLVNIGSGFTEWESLSTLGVPWSALTNASTALTLNNAGNTTTFNQTSAVAWLWANTTTATGGTGNASPLLELAANYWTGAASAQDTWTLGTSLAAGTNGVSLLGVTHTGSSGNSFFSLQSGVAGIQLQTNTGIIDFGSNTAYALNFANNNGGTTNGSIAAGALYIGLASSAAGSRVYLEGNVTTQSSTAISIGNGSSFTGTAAGTQVGLSIGSGAGTGGSAGFTFNPANGSKSFVACQIAPTIEGTSSGNTTALYVNPTLTPTNLSGTNMIAIFASGGTQKAAIDYSGNYYSGTTVGVTQTAEAVGTLATIGGIVTTFTAVSDDRLKDAEPYADGLKAILGIKPIKYRWNKEGQKHSGQGSEKAYIGFSAQNVEELIPEAVWQSNRHEYLCFEDRPVIAALVNAVKELKAEIDVLKARQ